MKAVPIRYMSEGDYLEGEKRVSCLGLDIPFDTLYDDL
jgi:hypothetical protein